TNLFRRDTLGDLADDLGGSWRARRRNVNDSQFTLIFHANGNFVFLQSGGHERKDSGIVACPCPDRYGRLFLCGRAFLRLILGGSVLRGKLPGGGFPFPTTLS